MVAQWRAQCANREAKSAREASAQSASHRGVWGPSPRKILTFIPSLVQSWDETAGFNNLLARLSIHIIGPAAAAPAAPTPTALSKNCRIGRALEGHAAEGSE